MAEAESLEGLDLDIAAAHAEIARGALDIRLSDAGMPTIMTFDHGWEPFRPSVNWAHAGPIIEGEHISLDWDDDAGQWYAQLGHVTQSSPIPLVAAMRAYVARE